MQEIIKRIYDYSLEEIMGERFGRYSKTIIQDRALPDVRDGLKPVQRRILFSMYKDKNTYEKGYRKSAKTVGNVMGSYHPHGDSSIYEAMVRMSQWWKQSTIYVDMHGNNGSMDGDSPAAMRYTEARLSKISNELLKDLDRDTVIWAPNYDDTAFEPTVLPAKFPNLLVNGSSGISAGYATNIPSHNLSEIIDATIKRIDSPNCYLDTILDIVKGPDFATGGIVEGKEGLKDAYQTGRGKIIIRAKLSFEKNKNKEQIIVTEIPYDVNKSTLVKRIDDIRIDKKIEGIQEVRDESDREGLRIAIDFKKGADKELVLNYLYKNTDLQISYNFNMVAIVKRRPMTLGILEILDAYIDHQKTVIIKRTEYDLNFAKERLHIVEGLIKMISILDQVITTIRKSENKQDSIMNLMKEFKFSEKQATAIVSLQLYRLTNTDVVLLEEELSNLLKSIELLEKILSDEETLKSVMKDELRKVKKEYGYVRRTKIKDEVLDISFDTTLIIPKEDVIVVVTKDGYVKRVSLKSYALSSDDTFVKEQDYVIGLYELNTLDTLLLFTDKGNYVYIPVHELPDLKWKDLGKHISNIVKLEAEENIVYSMPVTDFEKEYYVTIFTKNGMIKKSCIKDFDCQRYSKSMTAIKLKDKDKVVSVEYGLRKEVFIVTKNGYGLWFDLEEVSSMGIKTSGVKAINLKNDEVVSGNIFEQEAEYITLITNKNTGKRVKISEFDKSTRSRKGLQVIRDVKTNPYHIIGAYVVNNREMIGIKTKEDIDYIKTTELPILDRYSTGSSIGKHKILTSFIKKNKEEKEEITEIKETVSIDKKNISLKEIDERIMTIDDFLEEFDK